MTKIVDFHYYCPLCEHYTLTEEEEPCCDCLEISVRDDSQKPEYWEEKK